LLHASVMMGAACGTCSSQAWQGLSVYGQAIGLAFQVVDDILDVTADSGTLGKTAGKDAAQDKPTYVSVLGLSASRRYAEQLHTLAMQGLQQTGLPDVRTLIALADWVIRRAY
jgi:farnesyl diphosphate synthase